MYCEHATNKLQKLLIHLEQVDLQDIDFDRLWVFNTNKLNRIESNMDEIKNRITDVRKEKAKHIRNYIRN